MNKRANFLTWFSFVFTAFIIVIGAAIVVPTSNKVTTAAFTEGRELLLKANTTLGEVQNATVRANAQTNIGLAYAKDGQNRIIIISLFSFLWIIIIMITALFMYVKNTNKTNLRRAGLI